MIVRFITKIRLNMMAQISRNQNNLFSNNQGYNFETEKEKNISCVMT